MSVCWYRRSAREFESNLSVLHVEMEQKTISLSTISTHRRDPESREVKALTLHLSVGRSLHIRRQGMLSSLRCAVFMTSRAERRGGLNVAMLLFPLSASWIDYACVDKCECSGYQGTKRWVFFIRYCGIGSSLLNIRW